jgi:hypothetical protein
VQAPLRAFVRERGDAPKAMEELVRRFAEAI